MKLDTDGSVIASSRIEAGSRSTGDEADGGRRNALTEGHLGQASRNLHRTDQRSQRGGLGAPSGPWR